MPAAFTEFERARRYEPEELLAIAHCAPGWGAMSALARKLQRLPMNVYQKRRAMMAERGQRMACGAFLPDDGVPYSARMAVLFKSVS